VSMRPALQLMQYFLEFYPQLLDNLMTL